jgi:hypothetical protein
MTTFNFSTDEALDLYWHTCHTQKVWRDLEAYFRLLERKRAKGIYCPEKARKGLLAHITASARDYSREHSTGTDWASMFSVAARREVVDQIMSDTEAEWSVGNGYSEEIAA